MRRWTRELLLLLFVFHGSLSPVVQNRRECHPHISVKTEELRVATKLTSACKGWLFWVVEGCAHAAQPKRPTS
ncbi:hypothetical protein DFJ73DRAFT_881119 [Zopfochytrium polystomum]|nr:hypothetical protein DFJ73DRAFT_881119 [Zopfochytrium polystomum]